MQLGAAKLGLVLTLTAAALCGCAKRSDPTVSATLAEDDDAICRANNVAPGSPEYIACRKDRDLMRDRAASRGDRRQRDLGEYMMNHPDHP
jgi:hypothetical protein